MIEIKSYCPPLSSINNNYLKYSFGDTCPGLRVEFKRTMRIPVDGTVYVLPDGYDNFRISHIEDYADKVPEQWVKRGGVIIPMYQSEALLLRFNNGFTYSYPIAVKVAVGKINALTRESWCDELKDNPQDYFVVPYSQNLGGYHSAKDIGRQFVASPLGNGLSPEEQITNADDYGGIQIIAYPLKEDIIRKIKENEDGEHEASLREYPDLPHVCARHAPQQLAMSLALGGEIRQDLIEEDTFDIDDWDTEKALRYFVHIVNSEHYEQITGHSPPHWPLSKKNYVKENIPLLFKTESKISLMGSKILSRLKTIGS